MGTLKAKLGGLGVVLLTPLLVNCGKSSFQYEMASPAPDIGPSKATSTMTISNNNIADGSTPAIVTFTIKDSSGSPISGVVMNLTIGGSQNTVMPCSPSNSQGLSQCVVYSTMSETKSFVGWGALTFDSENVWFAPVEPLRSAFSIVSAGSVETLPSGHVIIASAGILESDVLQKDSSNTMRVYSSILGSIVGESL